MSKKKEGWWAWIHRFAGHSGFFSGYCLFIFIISLLGCYLLFLMLTLLVIGVANIFSWLVACLFICISCLLLQNKFLILT